MLKIRNLPSVKRPRVICQRMYNREKLGFPVPIKDWLREEKFYQIVRDVFTQDFVKEFFDQEKIVKLLDDNFAGTADGRRKIWTIYTF